MREKFSAERSTGVHTVMFIPDYASDNKRQVKYLTQCWEEIMASSFHSEPLWSNLFSATLLLLRSHDWGYFQFAAGSSKQFLKSEQASQSCEHIVHRAELVICTPCGGSVHLPLHPLKPASRSTRYPKSIGAWHSQGKSQNSLCQENHYLKIGRQNVGETQRSFVWKWCAHGHYRPSQTKS